jgi:hypothetical protein
MVCGLREAEACHDDWEDHMDPFSAKCLELLREVEGKNVLLTFNNSNHRGLVFVYSGDNWEAFSEAIRQAVDRVQEALLERRSHPS